MEEIGRVLPANTERLVERSIGIVARDCEIRVPITPRCAPGHDDLPIGLRPTVAALSSNPAKSVVTIPPPPNDVSKLPSEP